MAPEALRRTLRFITCGGCGRANARGAPTAAATTPGPLTAQPAASAKQVGGQYAAAGPSTAAPALPSLGPPGPDAFNPALPPPPPEPQDSTPLGMAPTSADAPAAEALPLATKQHEQQQQPPTYPSAAPATAGLLSPASTAGRGGSGDWLNVSLSPTGMHMVKDQPPGVSSEVPASGAVLEDAAYEAPLLAPAAAPPLSPPTWASAGQRQQPVAHPLSVDDGGGGGAMTAYTASVGGSSRAPSPPPLLPTSAPAELSLTDMGVAAAVPPVVPPDLSVVVVVAAVSGANGASRPPGPMDLAPETVDLVRVPPAPGSTTSASVSAADEVVVAASAAAAPLAEAVAPLLGGGVSSLAPRHSSASSAATGSFSTPLQPTDVGGLPPLPIITSALLTPSFDAGVPATAATAATAAAITAAAALATPAMGAPGAKRVEDQPEGLSERPPPGEVAAAATAPLLMSGAAFGSRRLPDSAHDMASPPPVDDPTLAAATAIAAVPGAPAGVSGGVGSGDEAEGSGAAQSSTVSAALAAIAQPQVSGPSPPPPSPLLGPTTVYMAIPPSTGLAGAWVKDAERSTTNPQPIDTLIGAGRFVRGVHESVKVLEIAETPAQFTIKFNASVAFGIPLTHTEVYYKDGSPYVSRLRRDLSMGSTTYRMYCITDGLLVLSYDTATAMGKTDQRGVSVLQLLQEPEGPVLKSSQVVGGGTAHQEFYGRKRG